MLTGWATEAWSTGRRNVRQFQRIVADAVSGHRSRLIDADTARADGSFAPRIRYVQPVRDSDGAAEKRHNIRLAASCIEDRVVGPGEVFSFWHIIGRPSAERGFQAGRSIVDGRVVRDPGGGLCQLAGMLHVLAIRSGLGILESHAHSRDLYTEASRYAPLGSDAAVAFAYKDLRLENVLDQPVSFRIEVTRHAVCVVLASPQPVDEYAAEFVRHDAPHQRLAATYRRCPRTGERTLLRVARYSRLRAN